MTGECTGFRFLGHSNFDFFFFKEKGIQEKLTRECTGFRFLDHSNYRDVCCLGNSDDCVKELAQVLGWCSELDALVSGLKCFFLFFSRVWRCRAPDAPHLSVFVRLY